MQHAVEGLQQADHRRLTDPGALYVAEDGVDRRQDEVGRHLANEVRIVVETEEWSKFLIEQRNIKREGNCPGSPFDDRSIASDS